MLPIELSSRRIKIFTSFAGGCLIFLPIYLQTMADTAEGRSASDTSKLVDYVQPPQFLFSASTKMTPVKIIASGLTLSIPRNYLQILTMDHDKANFGLIIFFPDFAGVTESRLEQYQLNRSGLKDAIEIYRLPYLDSGYLTSIKHYLAAC